MYRALSGDGNPSFATVLKVARALGMKLHAEVAYIASALGARLKAERFERKHAALHQ